MRAVGARRCAAEVARMAQRRVERARRSRPLAVATSLVLSRPGAHVRPTARAAAPSHHATDGGSRCRCASEGDTPSTHRGSMRQARRAVIQVPCMPLDVGRRPPGDVHDLYEARAARRAPYCQNARPFLLKATPPRSRTSRSATADTCARGKRDAERGDAAATGLRSATTHDGRVLNRSPVRPARRHARRVDGDGRR